MNSASAILLAAGESRRMGGTNKLGLPVHGVPLLRRTVMTLLGARLKEIVVVLGHEQETARSLLADLPLRLVVNEHYHDGQMSSVHCGLAALQAPCDGVMVCLSDQPLLETADIDRLIDAFLHRCSSAVLVPTYRGQRGNPIILARQHCQSILDGDRNLGCKHFIEESPELVTVLEMDNDHVVFDLDSPADYKVLQSRLNAERRKVANTEAVHEV